MNWQTGPGTPIPDGTADQPGWRKSSYSASNGSCVEFQRVPGGVLLRDLEGDTVAYSDAEWVAFLAGVKAGEFDL